MAARGGAGGLRSQQQEAERKARELMDLKIEAAHLRERLRARVGGDATAAELEAETFALQTALQEAQETLSTRDQQLQTLDGKYQQAMRGMLQLDEAWKQSTQQTREMQETLQTTRQRLQEAQDRAQKLQDELQNSNQRETTLADRVDVLVQEKAQVEGQRDAQSELARQAETLALELRAQLEATRQNFETQMKQQEGATREDVKRLETQLQRAVEEAAALRGEIHARQEAAAKMETEVKDIKQVEAATRQRLVKLTEEHAVLRVQMETARHAEKESAAREIKTRCERERLEKQLKERGELLQEKEQTVRRLEEELVQQQKALEDEIARKKEALETTEQRMVLESQEMLQAQEETWICREKVLQQEAEAYKQELSRLGMYHSELAQLLTEKELRTEEVVKSELQQPRTVTPTQLRTLVKAEIKNRQELSALLEQTKTKLSATQRQLGAQKQLECENDKLRVEYEKAKLAMERMATRKAKSFVATAQQQGHSRSSSSEKNNCKENRFGDPLGRQQFGADRADEDLTLTPRKRQRAKRVYVASRYLGTTAKR